MKAAMKEELIASNDAIAYSEPEKMVMSRSGDECVVALTDQWYLTYGEDEWLSATRQVRAVTLSKVLQFVYALESVTRCSVTQLCPHHGVRPPPLGGEI